MFICKSLICGGKWLFVGQLDDRFLPYLVDFLLHVTPKVQGKFDFFFLQQGSRYWPLIGVHIQPKQFVFLEGITSLELMY